jgi:hypothetical protein
MTTEATKVQAPNAEEVAEGGFVHSETIVHMEKEVLRYRVYPAELHTGALAQVVGKGARSSSAHRPMYYCLYPAYGARLRYSRAREAQGKQEGEQHSFHGLGPIVDPNLRAMCRSGGDIRHAIRTGRYGGGMERYVVPTVRTCTDPHLCIHGRSCNGEGRLVDELGR